MGHQLRRAGLTMRRGDPPAHPASTQQILELRDEGLTWNGAATGRPSSCTLRGYSCAVPQGHRLEGMNLTRRLTAVSTRVERTKLF